MIKKIILENFKAFEYEQSFDLKPITLVYGENSSGKSTILNAILLQKQTQEESANPNTVMLFKGSYTDQQNYSRCINGRDTNKKLKIGLRCQKASTKYNDYYVEEGVGGHDEHSGRMEWFGFKYFKDITMESNYAYIENHASLKSIEFRHQGDYFCKIVKIENKDEILKETYSRTEKDWSREEWEHKDKIPDEILFETYVTESEFLNSVELDENCFVGNVRNLDIYRIDTSEVSKSIILKIFENANLASINNDWLLQPLEKRDYLDFERDLLLYLDSIIFFVKNGLPVHFSSLAGR